MAVENQIVILTTERLKLREVTYDDAHALTDVLCDSEVMKYSMGTLSQSEVKTWVKRAILDYEHAGIGNWAIEETSTGNLIGYCGLTLNPDQEDQGVELNYRLAKRYWNKGFATEIASAVIQFAKSQKPASRLYAVVDPHNERSLNVARKLGMTFENEIWLDEYDYPDYLFTLHFDD